MSFIKLFASQAASNTVVSVSFDVPLDGMLTSILMGSRFSEAALADGMIVNAEASFSSTPQFTSSDVRNSLGQCSSGVIGAGAAAAIYGSTPLGLFVAHNLEIKVFAGERIFLHLQQTATIDASSAVAYFHIRDGDDRGARPRSRR